MIWHLAPYHKLKAFLRLTLISPYFFEHIHNFHQIKYLVKTLMMQTVLQFQILHIYTDTLI